MNITPGSSITLYGNVQCSPNENIAFRSVAAQQAYFRTKVKAQNVKCTYVRRTGLVKFQATPEIMRVIDKCNYVSFTNPAFENRIFYAFLDNWDYVNNRTVVLRYTLDYWQTYMFDVTFDGGVVDREYLSESDFQLAEQNPWNNDIFELTTAEEVAVGQTLYEPVESISAKIYPEDESEYNTAIVIFLSDFSENVPGGRDELLKKFTESYSPNGTGWTNIPGDLFTQIPGSADWVVMRGYWTFVIWNANRKYVASQFKDALDYLTLVGLSDAILSIVQTSKAIWESYIKPRYDDTVVYSTGMVKPMFDSTNVDHFHKILRSPFNFIRVMNNSGESSDYNYEDFASVPVSGQHLCVFQYVPLFDGTPVASLVPIDYFIKGGNIAERIDSTNFPQIGYNTDSFLAYYATQMQQNLASRSAYTENPVVRASENVAPYVTAVGNALDVGSNIIKGDFQGAAAAALDTTAERQQFDLAMREQANQYRQNPEKIGLLYQAKPGHVMQKYTPGNNAPNLNDYVKNVADIGHDYNNGSGVFLLLAMHMRNDVIDVYRDKFKRTGYTSGRFGNPRICNYVSGGDDLPHFNSENYTYVECHGLHVKGMSNIICESISNFFAAGVRFYKGEAL